MTIEINTTAESIIIWISGLILIGWILYNCEKTERISRTIEKTQEEDYRDIDNWYS